METQSPRNYVPGELILPNIKEGSRYRFIEGSIGARSILRNVFDSGSPSLFCSRPVTKDTLVSPLRSHLRDAPLNSVAQRRPACMRALFHLQKSSKNGGRRPGREKRKRALEIRESRVRTPPGAASLPWIRVPFRFLAMCSPGNRNSYSDPSPRASCSFSLPDYAAISRLTGAGHEYF